MKSKQVTLHETEYTVRFTAKEVTKMLVDIVKQEHPHCPDEPRVWGFERGNYRVMHEPEYQDLVITWRLKHG